MLDFAPSSIEHSMIPLALRTMITRMAVALADRSQIHVLNVLIDQADRSPGMVRLARRLGKKLSTYKP